MKILIALLRMIPKNIPQITLGIGEGGGGGTLSHIHFHIEKYLFSANHFHIGNRREGRGCNRCGKYLFRGSCWLGVTFSLSFLLFSLSLSLLLSIFTNHIWNRREGAIGGKYLFRGSWLAFSLSLSFFTFTFNFHFHFHIGNRRGERVQLVGNIYLEAAGLLGVTATVILREGNYFAEYIRPAVGQNTKIHL